jgi:hypothetical protein
MAMAPSSVRTEKVNPTTEIHMGISFGDTNVPMTVPAKANLLMSMRYVATYSHCFGVNGMKSV